jgi:pimeloyl-ACP methyl ester carboxylesterase
MPAHSLKLAGLLLLLIGLATLSHAQDDANATNPYTTIPCAYPTPRGLQAECGLLRVPEDYTQPDGRMVELAVMRVLSPARNPAPDPLLHLVGGPGGSSVPQAARIFHGQFAPFARQRDVIFVDQRGTGYSHPRLYCSEIRTQLDDLLIREASPQQANAVYIDLLRQCRERLAEGHPGLDFNQYNSANIVRDLERLRVAMGYEQWNLIGVSYGSRLALTAMRDAPQGLRSVILDSVYPPQVNLFTEILPNAERALDVLFAACEADFDCRQAYPQLEQTFNTLYADLNAQPQRLQVQAPELGQFMLPVDGDRVYRWVFGWLYAVSDIRTVPRRIAAMADDNFTESIQAGIADETNITLIDLAMHYSVQCQEEAAFLNPADFAAVAAAFPQRAAYLLKGSDLGASLFDLCALWSPSADPREAEPVSSAVPALLLAGNFDPITPPAWAELAAQTLDNHYLYVLPDVGHGVVRSSACGMSLAVAFLNDPTRAPDASCLDDLIPMQFETRP